nr:FDL1 protein [Lemna aequinoctialis]
MRHHQKQQHYISPSSSSSSSFLPLRTMEEVWKDITLNASSPLAENIPQQAYFQNQMPSGLNISHFRDFRPRPLRPISGAVQLATAPPPATVLSLTSATDPYFLKTIIPPRETHSSSSTTTCSSSSSASSSTFSVLCNKKRAPQQQLPDPGSDLGHNKRMIKNRESAARSRARKQAYTNELEMEVNQLTVENERLRYQLTQQEELRAKMAAQMSTKRALERSSTAPF